MKNQITALIANDAGEIFDVPEAEGVGRVGNNFFVLSPFTQEDAEKISTTLDELVPAVLCIFKEGINNAMNKFNPKRQKANEESNNSIDSQ